MIRRLGRPRSWPPLAWPLVGALVLRVAWAGGAAGAGPLFLMSGDQYSYWYLGMSIADGDGYSLPSHEPTAYYPVGFPLVLAGLYWLSNHTFLPDGEVWITAGYHVAIGTAIVWLVHAVACATFGRRTALAAAWITALFPNLVFYVATFSLELTFIALTLGALAVIVQHDWESGLPSRRRLAAFGALLAAATLVRPFALPLLVGLGAACLQRGTTWRAACRLVAVPAFVVAAVLSPWTVRNAVQLDAFVPMSTNLGDTLCMDRTMDSNGEFRFADEDGCADPELAEVERNRINTFQALVFAANNPLKEAELVVLRAYRMLEDDHTGLEEVEANGSVTFSDSGFGQTLAHVADVFFYVVGSLALVGAWLDRRRWFLTPQRTLFVATAGGLLLIPLGLWGNPRFHVPLLPFMAIAAAHGAGLLVTRRRLPYVGQD